MERPILILLLAIAMLVPTALPAAGQIVPEDAEAAILSKPTPRGGVTWNEHVQTAATPTAKVVDGSIDDWVGAASRLGATTVLDRGELVYQDVLFDDFGADDGKDAQRNADLAPAYDAEPRSQRAEALTQAAGEQFGADDQDPTDGYLTGPANYGDAVYPPGTEGQADLLEVRLAADGTSVYVLARFAALEDPSAPALFIAAFAPRDGPPSGISGPMAFNSDLGGAGILSQLYADARGVYQAQATGAAPGAWEVTRVADADVAVEAAGTTNAIEIELPRRVLSEGGEGSVRLGIGAGIAATDADGDPALADVTPGTDGANLLNVAFREEPTVANWFDKRQAMALGDGTLDPFVREVDLDALADGTTVPWQATPGYHERVFGSRADISSETLTQGPKETRVQHYGLYLPTSWSADDEVPLTVWLHWRGGTAHQAPAWTPRVVEQLGEERTPANAMIFPRGRGTATWYTGAGHVDVLEALEDVQDAVAIDPDRRYVAGYSMGGYGSYLFGLLYPDVFAGAYPISGAMTQGLWLGADDEQGRDMAQANGGDANVQLTYRLIENARNLPYVIHHGTDDELVPVTGVERMAARFAELGYRHTFYRFLGYEHYSQAVVDEWKEGARYLDAHEREDAPARVVYKRVPALEHATETFESRGAEIELDTDGAYWVSGMTLRETTTTDPTVHGMIDAITEAIPDAHATEPTAGAAAPGHSTPYVMDGLTWTQVACIPEVPLCPGQDAARNAFEGELSNLATVTLDLERMQLDAAEVLTGTLTTDGPSEVSLDAAYSDGVSVACASCPPLSSSTEDGALVLTLHQAGTYEVTIDPAG